MATRNHFSHLDKDARKAIEDGVYEGRSLAWIAESIGVDATTVSRELRRNRRDDGYSTSLTSRNRCAFRKGCKRKRLCDPGCRKKCSSCAKANCNSLCDGSTIAPWSFDKWRPSSSFLSSFFAAKSILLCSRPLCPTLSFTIWKFYAANGSSWLHLQTSTPLNCSNQLMAASASDSSRAFHSFCQLAVFISIRLSATSLTAHTRNLISSCATAKPNLPYRWLKTAWGFALSPRRTSSDVRHSRRLSCRT